LKSTQLYHSYTLINSNNIELRTHKATYAKKVRIIHEFSVKMQGGKNHAENKEIKNLKRRKRRHIPSYSNNFLQSYPMM